MCPESFINNKTQGKILFSFIFWQCSLTATEELLFPVSPDRSYRHLTGSRCQLVRHTPVYSVSHKHLRRALEILVFAFPTVPLTGQRLAEDYQAEVIYHANAFWELSWEKMYLNWTSASLETGSQRRVSNPFIPHHSSLFWGIYLL